MTEVAEFLARLDHPLKPALSAVVDALRGAAPGTAEGIKWKAPSFYVKATGQFFATVSLHGRPGRETVLLVLHQDAKTTQAARDGVAIQDPDGLLEWPSKDRAVVRFTDAKDAQKKAQALRAIVRQWVAAM